ncbi:MAG: FtsX-like permease family protein [Candidatus Bipolaricaulota bacterium]|nr:FtsX-like permease family protein [Candidatus Bipolaricaulota bacterium]MCS7275084.1 FtsX-like permease family protein [Candidatus Bipolaricaulota bacterium]MDW8110412.1 FtsX-like permease family protein [Candidatus Bipolaricaulota bacterium]MDW8329517.1 FtsX-like permease family protein [Candidatus Bipolaricaulota bacterium]
MELKLLIPLRNLTRNRRRTLLSLAIIALGTAMIYAVRGYVDESMLSIRQGTVRQFGNLQIASPLLWAEKTENFGYLISPEDVARIVALLQEIPEVTAHTVQLNLSGLAITERKTKVVRATALEPQNQALDYNDLVVEGSGLNPDDRAKVLIGRALSEELQLQPGDFFSLTTTTVDGAYNVGPLQVAGIYALNNAVVEGQLVFMPLGYGQILLDTSGVAKVIVTLRSIDDTDRIAQIVQRKLTEAGLEFEVRTWVQLAEFYRQIKGFFDVLFGFLTIAVSVLVFFIVLQVLTLSFLERTREVGTIRAIGTKRYQVFLMFFMESVFLGVLGGLLGIAGGWLIGQGFNALGIGWTPPGAIEPVPVRLRLELGNALGPFLVGVFATLLSALYPAAHSARLNVVEALASK